eukprot:COSAG02_NODE_37238_length_444_cov_1.107246_1_plen_44_part_10
MLVGLVRVYNTVSIDPKKFVLAQSSDRQRIPHFYYQEWRAWSSA